MGRWNVTDRHPPYPNRGYYIRLAQQFCDTLNRSKA